MNPILQKTPRVRRFGFARSTNNRSNRTRNAPWRRPGSLIEVLEDRTLLSSLTIINGGLIYLANSGLGSAGLTVSTTGPGGTYTFADNQPIILFQGAIDAGWTLSPDSMTATGPNDSVTSIQLTSNPTDDTFSILSVDANTTIDSGDGADTINLTANGIPAAVTVTVANPSIIGSDFFTIDTGGTPGTFATGQLGRETYQAAGEGLIDITTTKPGVGDSLTGLASGALTLNLNTLFSVPTALDTTISVSMGELEADVSGVFPRFFPINDLASVFVGGTSAGESLTIDYSNGDPLPSSGLTYEPDAATGGASNLLTLQGGSFTSEVYDASGPGAGSITYDGTKTITFSNLSPINDTVPSPTFVFNPPPGAQTVNVVVGPIVGGVQTVQINDGGTGTFELINFANKTVATVNTVPATPPVGTAVTITAAEGQFLNQVVVATFTESDPGNVATDFTSSINWGDNTAPSIGTIQPNGVSNGYNILSSHTYAAAGTYAVNVTLTYLGSTRTIIVAGDTVNLTTIGPVNSIPDPIPSVANVGAAPLNAEGATVTGQEGIALNPAVNGDVLVATFMDTGTIGAPAGYAASIDWGDGTTTAATQITSQGTPNGVVFSVFGNHTYAEEGSYPITVTITKTALGATAIASSQAVIADALLTAGAAVALTPNTGVLLSNTVVGSFTDANTAAPLSDFSATIDWGDGTATSLGTVVAGGAAGTFNVEGTHAYAKPGTYATTIVVSDVGGSKVTLTGTATVTDLPVTGTVRSFRTVEGQDTGTIVLATFTDPNPLATTSSVTATLLANGWGDNTPGAPVTLAVTQIGGTATSTIFQVLGSHTYAEEGAFTVSISVTNSDGVTTALTSGTATVVDAPVTASGTSITGIEGITTGNVIIATFSDANPGAAVADFTAGGGSVVVSWGDGSAPETLPASDVTAAGSANGVLFTVTAAHTYPEEGQYQLTVTITDDGGSKASANGSATIADAVLTGVTPPPIVSVSEAVRFSGMVAVFTDANPNGTAAEFRATIDWGDGSPETTGVITKSGTSFLVSGTHTYADSLPVGVPGSGLSGPQNGTYPITIYVTDFGGSKVNLTNTATVTDVALLVTGMLNPASDSGVSNSDNITNVVQPNFLGTTSEPNATVSLYAQPTSGGAIILIGQGVSNANDAWSITSNQALADGSYAITAIAIDSSGHTISNTTTIVANLVIDTAGPKVTTVFFNRLHGQIDVTFQDYGGPTNAGVGLNLATEIDANNYAFTKVHHPRLGAFRVNVISVTPGTTTGAQMATLSINKGHSIRGGFYFFTIRSVSPANLTGVQDIAGNALDGEFYGFFPSGNNHPGGNFVAQLSAIHHTIFAPSTVVGRATPVSPPGTLGHNVTVSTTVNPSKLSHAVVGAKAASKSKARNSGSAARAVSNHHAVGAPHVVDKALDQIKVGKSRRS